MDTPAAAQQSGNSTTGARTLWTKRPSANGVPDFVQYMRETDNDGIGPDGKQIPGFRSTRFKRWRDELALLGKDAFPGSGFTRDQEVSALKRELAQVTKERDFLRQAAAYFARRSQ